MKNKQKITVELHIKIPVEQNEFLEEFKSEFKVSKQAFIIDAVKEKINKLNSSK